MKTVIILQLTEPPKPLLLSEKYPLKHPTAARGRETPRCDAGDGGVPKRNGSSIQVYFDIQICNQTLWSRLCAPRFNKHEM
jgi:hypothetical protein